MPKYTFNVIVDDSFHPFEDLVELKDHSEARRTAARVAAEIAQDTVAERDATLVTVEVMDETRKIIVVATASVSSSEYQ